MADMLTPGPPPDARGTRQQQLTPALEVYAESRRAVRLYEHLGWQRTAEYTGKRHWRGQSPTVYVYLAPDPAP